MKKSDNKTSDLDDLDLVVSSNADTNLLARVVIEITRSVTAAEERDEDQDWSGLQAVKAFFSATIPLCSTYTKGALCQALWRVFNERQQAKSADRDKVAGDTFDLTIHADGVVAVNGLACEQTTLIVQQGKIKEVYCASRSR